MPVYQAVVLAVVQAFGEFLPISSSAHLILTRWFFGWSELDPTMDLTFDVALHAGTLLAVLIYFFPTWINLIVAGFGGQPKMSASGAGFGNVDDVESGRDRMLLWWIVLGTVPGAIAGKLAWGEIGEIGGQVAGGMVGGVAWATWLFLGRGKGRNL